MNTPDAQRWSIAGSSRLVITGLALAGIVALSFALDGLAYRHITIHGQSRPLPIEAKDWYRMLRVAGYWPTWVLAGAVIVLGDRAVGRANPFRRGVFLALASGAAGLGAEIVKGLVGRMRPEDTGGEAFRFMAIDQRWAHWSDLSMPSSHAAVAFGAAFAVAWMWRGTCPVMMGLAVGCGLTRILAGAHFASDVAGAVPVAFFMASAVRWLDARNNGGAALGSERPLHEGGDGGKGDVHA